MCVFLPEGNRVIRGPELSSHLKMTPETPKERASDETGEPVVCYMYDLVPTPLSLIHFEFLKKNPNTKHSRPSEFVVFFT